MAIKKTVRKTIKRKHKKQFQRGAIGSFFVYGILALLIVLGAAAIGNLPSTTSPNSGQVVTPFVPTQSATYSNLQLKWFGYVTGAPTPAAPPPLCTNKTINNEQYILVGYSPGPGQTTHQNGTIKVWANDEHAPFISYGEQVNPITGQITTPGNRNQKAPDGLYYEPALSIGSNTTTYFPDFIYGQYNNKGNETNRNTWNTVVSTKKLFSNGKLYETPPPGSGIIGGKNPNGPAPNQYVAEFVWNVSNLNLSPGIYQALFSIHDGDDNRAIGCVNITIQ